MRTSDFSGKAIPSPLGASISALTAEAVVAPGNDVLSSPKFISTVLDTLRTLVIVTDVGGRVVHFNRACETTSGWTLGDVKGKTLSETPLSPEDMEVAERIFTELCDGQRTALAESCWRCRDGSRRLIAWSSCALHGLNGDIQYIVRTGVDITEQRRLEDELHFASHRARRLMVAGELATTLAHEISQPLAAIASYSEACLQHMQRNFLPWGKLRQNIEQIVAQAQRAGKVIGEMRSFLTQGDLVREPIDTNALVLAVCEQMAARAESHHIAFELHLAESLPTVTSIQTHIERVLLNLLRNAIEAIRDAGMPDGWIRVETCMTADGMVKVTLGDSGPGLDAKTAERIFEPFYTTKPDGLGVGLALSRSLIESHGGEIWVDTNVINGSTFHFTLPVTR